MTRERFEYLFQQYRADRLSQEDWEELRQAIREGGYDSYIQNEFLKLVERDRVHKTWSPQLESAMWKQIRGGTRVSLFQKTAGRPIEPAAFRPSANKKIAGYAIAASVAAIFSLVLFFRPAPRQNPVAAVKKTEINIHPGGNKAILTLPNGSKIILDNSPDGQIAREGTTAFHKTEGVLRVSALPGIATGKTPSPADQFHGGDAFISTPRGGQFELVLPDGTRVWLNSASSLRFPTAFTGKQRAVELSGEGYFEVAKNARMPFVVTVNQMKIQVMGTHFDAMAYNDEKTINTTLLEGSVIVSQGDLIKKLEPGQQASLNAADHQLTVGKADLQKTIAWKNGLFEFDNTDLPTIMRQLARWYDIEVVYRVKPDNAALGGSISRNLNLTEVLSLLEANGINHFKIEGKKVLVLL